VKTFLAPSRNFDAQKYDKITMMSAAIAMLSTSTNQQQNQARQIF